MASRSRMAPARASGVASDPCAAAMRTMTSAYAAMTRLCSLAYPNHATPPRRRAARAAPVRTRSVRREGAIIAREDLSNTAVRTRGTEASPARRAARCGRRADSAGNCASPSRGRGRPRAPRRPPAVERRGRPPREHANRGSRTVKHGGARRPPGRRWTSATYVSFPRARVPVPSGEVHEDRAALDVDGIPGHLDRGVVDVGAGRDVPAPGVPGAGHHAPVELALAERPAPVGARVVDRVVHAVHVEQGQRLALDLDHPALARRHVADGGDPYPSRLYHRSRSSRRRPYSITPRRPLWLPIYQRRPSASTIIFRIPTSFDGSVKTRSASVLGSRRTTVSVWISLTHTAPAPSIVTAYGPPRSPAGSAYSFTTFCAAGSTRTSLPRP